MTARRRSGARLAAALLLNAAAVCACAGLPPAASVDGASDVDELAAQGPPSDELGVDEPRAVSELERSLRAYTAASSERPARSLTPLRARSRASGRLETTRIYSPPEVEEHVGSRRRIDVKLHQAELTEALRFIAHSGGINLVVGQGVVGQVNVELRRVTPFAALRAIAQAHGARIVRAEASGAAPILIVERAR